MSYRKFVASPFLGIAVAGLLAGAVLAQDVPAFGVSDISCRELLTMGGDERDATLIFMNGYVSGTSGAEVIDPAALMAASDTVLANCIDSPDTPLITMLEGVRGG